MPIPKKNSRPNFPDHTIEYVQAFISPQRRPNVRMPSDSHIQAARLLKGVLARTSYRQGVWNRVNEVRSELDEWVHREYGPIERPVDHSQELYYPDFDKSEPGVLALAERDEHEKSLLQVRDILSEQYPDCEPVQTLQKKLDQAIKSLKKWGGASH